MLVLRRKKGETFLIGDSIRITVVDCAADGVRFAIDAPKQLSILREELSDAAQANRNSVIAKNMNALLSLSSALSHAEENTETNLTQNDIPLTDKKKGLSVNTDF